MISRLFFAPMSRLPTDDARLMSREVTPVDESREVDSFPVIETLRKQFH